jgi:predicted acetyltransferase
VNVRVDVAGPEEQARLAALFELYVYEFSAMLGIDVEDDGRFRVPPMDAYWADPRRHPFLIRVQDKLGDKLAGFALVHEQSRLTGDFGVCDVAEFFVMRKYRRHGVGERAAHWLFDRFRAPWEVREKAANEAATAFWRHAIGRYTGGAFEELVLDDERWRGPVQRFDSRHVRNGEVASEVEPSKRRDFER